MNFSTCYIIAVVASTAVRLYDGYLDGRLTRSGVLPREEKIQIGVGLWWIHFAVIVGGLIYGTPSAKGVILANFMRLLYQSLNVRALRTCSSRITFIGRAILLASDCAEAWGTYLLFVAKENS